MEPYLRNGLAYLLALDGNKLLKKWLCFDWISSRPGGGDLSSEWRSRSEDRSESLAD
jgi:hypothetical protein